MAEMTRLLHMLLLPLSLLSWRGDAPIAGNTPVWNPDNGDGTYTNPIIYADYSDPDAIRVGDNFYMISSSMNCTPGMPVLRSSDLVHWEIVSHVFERLPSVIYDTPRHGDGCWAPSLRYHKGEFWMYYGDPDLGIFMSKATRAEGPWEPLVRVIEAKGWIDPCPLWDDDGQLYLVHAWAKSRAGFNSVLTVHRLSSDGKSVLDEGRLVFDGTKHHPTIEGPKFYKRNGYYYIFAPAGGVPTGWQTVLRSRNVYGPYEDKIVMDQGTTPVNGPHQGAWVETESGESWFLHFQDRGPYGRIVHLQPMIWKDDWPVIGNDRDGDGKGEPVLRCQKPTGTSGHSIVVPQTSDQFSSGTIGLQWQWHANFRSDWYSLSARKGQLRLFSHRGADSSNNLWSTPNLLLQKFPAPHFSATTYVEHSSVTNGERGGLIVMGADYSLLALKRESGRTRLVHITCMNADKGSREVEQASRTLDVQRVHLRVEVDTSAMCRFSYSGDGSRFLPFGAPFQAKKGRWIGAKVGLFAIAPSAAKRTGHLDVDWFEIEP